MAGESRSLRRVRSLPRATGHGPPVRTGARQRPRSAVPPAADGYARVFDLTLITLVFGTLLPLWLVLAGVITAAVRLEDRGRVLYLQDRLGRGGRVFRMLKFRTMIEDAERTTGPVWSRPGDRRVTAAGRVLRRFHLDELPQVFNVLKGEMSLVGPRPERPALAARVERRLPGFNRRLAVRPGIAGLAQSRGRFRQSSRNKLRYDRVYIAAMGPWLDLKLLAACIGRTLARHRPAPAGRRGWRRGGAAGRAGEPLL